MKRLINYALLGVSAVLSLYGCKKNDTTVSSTQYSAEFHLADAAGPYDRLDMDIEKVEVETQSGNWYVMNTKSGPYDITQLTNGSDALLASATFTEDNITNVRITMGIENLVVISGQNFPLNAVSQNTVTIPVQLKLLPSQTKAFILDADAARSVTRLANGKYQLNPKFRIYSTGETGTISGTVSPANAMPSVYAIIGTDTFGTLAGYGGKFMIRGLNNGTYKLFLQGQNFPDKTVDGISVTAGQTTNVGIVTMQ